MARMHPLLSLNKLEALLEVHKHSVDRRRMPQEYNLICLAPLTPRGAQEVFEINTQLVIANTRRSSPGNRGTGLSCSLCHLPTADFVQQSIHGA